MPWRGRPGSARVGSCTSSGQRKRSSRPCWSTTSIETFQKDYLLENGDGLPQPELSAEIAGDREATTMPHSIALAVFGAMAEDQHLLAPVREHAKCRTALLRSEAEDPDEAMMKWFAGKGILFCSLLGINPLDDEGVDRLFRQLEKTGERG
jgi:hypothetical protein